MKINLIAVGTRLPDWVNQGFKTYADRLPPDFALTLTEITPQKRLKHMDLPRLLEEEAKKLLAATPQGSHLIALERSAQEVSTLGLSKQLSQWRDEGQSISLLIGGPEGLAPICIEKAQTVWSLSKLTLPHPLVRVLIAEQIYRAWSIMARHPYHR